MIVLLSFTLHLQSTGTKKLLENICNIQIIKYSHKCQAVVEQGKKQAKKQ
jgi:hypothetical protein